MCGYGLAGELEQKLAELEKEREQYTERQQYTNKFVGVLMEINKLARGQKTEKYGETWNRLGLKGIYLKEFIKMGRLHELIWEDKGHNDKQEGGETTRDTLLDIAAYAVYGVICYDEDNWDGDQQRYEFLQLMAGALISAISQKTKIVERTDANGTD